MASWEWQEADKRAVEQVSLDRIAARIEELSHIGRSQGGGITRLALSEEEDQARRLVASWLRPLGYDCLLDEACNLIARGPSDNGVVVGSHLDTVPRGGAYDGALGVVAAVEAAEALIRARRDICPRVVAWMGEEGQFRGRTLLGSAAALGVLSEDDWRKKDEDGGSLASLAEAKRQNWDDSASGTIGNDARCYLELHIEQGPNLASREIPVGVVSGIVGISHARVIVSGRADHAGTTPMEQRRDALTASSEMVLAAERSGLGMGGGLVVTVGQLDVSPGARNVVPSKVQFSLDIRSISDSSRRSFIATLRSKLEEIASRRKVSVRLSIDYEVPGVELDPTIRSLLKACVERAGIEAVEMPSGAVHDAQNWALAGYPTGMIFVQSHGGSHNPHEWADPAHAALGTRALVMALCKLPLERMSP